MSLACLPAHPHSHRHKMALSTAFRSSLTAPRSRSGPARVKMAIRASAAPLEPTASNASPCSSLSSPVPVEAGLTGCSGKVGGDAACIRLCKLTLAQPPARIASAKASLASVKAISHLLQAQGCSSASSCKSFQNVQGLSGTSTMGSLVRAGGAFYAAKGAIDCVPGPEMVGRSRLILSSLPKSQAAQDADAVEISRKAIEEAFSMHPVSIHGPWGMRRQPSMVPAAGTGAGTL